MRLSEEKNTKTTQKRLVRWVDRLLSFDFEIEHISGKKMSLVDYLSRHPHGISTKTIQIRQHFRCSTNYCNLYAISTSG